MKITYSFYSLKDLSNLSNGESLLEILLTNGLNVDKAGEQEPIQKDFVKENLSEIWKGRGLEGSHSTCYFLFKGKKEFKFSGMVTWNINLRTDTKTFNGVSLWLNVPKDYNVNNLVKIGDDIFKWSDAVYGYITEDSKDPHNDLRIGNIHEGLPGLLWVNYFGSSFIMQPDFHIPDDHVFIGNGKRIILAETPNAEKLSDLNFLVSIRNKFGSQWFWQYPRKFERKKPIFDKSEIVKL